MASSVEERQEKNLECGICLESFQEPPIVKSALNELSLGLLEGVCRKSRVLSAE